MANYRRGRINDEMQEKQAELGVTMSAYNNTSDKWVNCTDKFNLNAYLDIGIKQELPSGRCPCHNKLRCGPLRFGTLQQG